MINRKFNSFMAFNSILLATKIVVEEAKRRQATKEGGGPTLLFAAIMTPRDYGFQASDWNRKGMTLT